jgi:hypothetical protein
VQSKDQKRSKLSDFSKILFATIVLATSSAIADDRQTEIQRSMDRAKAIAAQDAYTNSNNCRAKDYATRTLDQYTLAKTRGVKGLDDVIARVGNDVAVWTALCEKDLAK